jgi:hypothetical protein
MNKMLLPLLQRRVASIAIGPSTARRLGPPGTIQMARQYLAAMNLADLSQVSLADYPSALDSYTDELIGALPTGAKYWGSARKFLNIFLRDVLYTHQLCKEWPLSHLEDVMEVPLDSHVALGLQEEPEGKRLPRWRTIIGLEPAVSARFQIVASEVALRSGFARVHLDLKYWRSEKRAKP